MRCSMTGLRIFSAAVALTAAGCGAEVDPVFSHSAVADASVSDIERWNQASAWGDHAAAGYLKAETDPLFSGSPAASVTSGGIATWDSAYAWGNHAAAGYLKAESDPLFSGSPAASVTSGDIGTWGTAYAWGDHAAAGYQTRVSGTCPTGTAINTVSSTGGVTCQNIPTYSAGAGLSLGGDTFSIPDGGIAGTMVAPGAIAVPQLSTFTAGIVSSTTDVLVRSHYVSISNSGGIASARVVVTSGGLNCGTSGCGPGVVTIVANGTTISTFNVNGDGTSGWTYLTPSFAVGPGTTIEVFVRAASAAAPVWIPRFDGGVGELTVSRGAASPARSPPSPGAAASRSPRSSAPRSPAPPPPGAPRASGA